MFNTDDITVLFAGAGAGKTTHLLKCVEMDLQTYRPEEIAFVSYTRKGAYEGKDRLVRKLNIDADRLEFFKTLHSLTYSALGYKQDQIFTPKHTRAFNKLLGFALTLSDEKDSNTADDKLFAIYDQRRSGHKDIYAEMDGFDVRRYKRLISAYESYKKKLGLYDYTDCLLNFIERGKPIPVKVAYIDEAQDLTTLQWKVCKVAFSAAEKIYVAGDDYQCQPTGSKVLTDNGYVNIEDLTEDSNLITYAQSDSAFYGFKTRKYKAEASSRPYKGELVNVLTDGG